MAKLLWGLGGIALGVGVVLWVPVFARLHGYSVRACYRALLWWR